jgi:pyroglutamyl-peptidase
LPAIYPELLLAIYEQPRMALTLLITGFGPFPGAPSNPTGPLVRALVRRRNRAFAGVRRVAHVFRTSYDTVDRELPALLRRERPDLLVMFGVATRSRKLRVETCARNVRSVVVPDAGGVRPSVATIAPDAPERLPLRAPAQRLAAAARSVGVPTQVSDDAGSYLCNYLCWRASETCTGPGALRLVTFVHVPAVWNTRAGAHCPPFTADHLVRAGEAILIAALSAARGH